MFLSCIWGFPDGSVVKNRPASAGDAGLIPGWGRSPGEGNGNPLWYGAWRATVQGIAEELDTHDLATEQQQQQKPCSVYGIPFKFYNLNDC